MKESDGHGTRSYLSDGNIVRWNFVHYKSFTKAFRAGFPMLGGYFSVGLNKKGNPVHAVRLYPNNNEELKLFKKRNTKKIRGLWNDQIKPLKNK